MKDNLDFQIHELYKYWHLFVKLPIYNDIKIKHPKLKKLTHNEIEIIRIIGSNDEIIIRDIVNGLNIPKSTLTNIINKLENEELIKREINNGDKRSYKLVLTKKGHDIQKQYERIEKEYFGNILSLLDNNKEREELIRLFKKILKNYQLREMNYGK